MIDAAAKAGVAVIGGHSITDPEPKYGMVVLGFVDPDRMLTNAAARPGDRLYLTKPLGLGMISTAVKRGVADAGAPRQRAVELMTTTNAAGVRGDARGAACSAATDVTGFGLLGHLHKLLLASGCAATVDAAAVPVIAGRAGARPRGCRAGRHATQPRVRRATHRLGFAHEPEQLILADAQTSGGLLLATTTMPTRWRRALARRGCCPWRAWAGRGGNAGRGVRSPAGCQE